MGPKLGAMPLLNASNCLGRMGQRTPTQPQILGASQGLGRAANGSRASIGDTNETLNPNPAAVMERCWWRVHKLLHSILLPDALAVPTLTSPCWSSRVAIPGAAAHGSRRSHGGGGVKLGSWREVSCCWLALLAIAPFYNARCWLRH